MKKFLKITFVVILGFGCLFGTVMLLTSPVTKAADTFLAAVSEQNHSDMTKVMSKDFIATGSMEQICSALHKVGLKNYRSSSWNSRSVDWASGSGEVEGFLYMEGGEAIGLKMVLLKEDGNWKVRSITVMADQDDAGIGLDLEMAKNLHRQALQDLKRSLNEGSLDHLYSTTSIFFQSEHSKAEFNQAFRSILPFSSELQVFTLSEPPIDCFVDEQFPSAVQTRSEATINHRITVTFGFHPEGTAWKLCRTELNVRPITVKLVR